MTLARLCLEALPTLDKVALTGGGSATGHPTHIRRRSPRTERHLPGSGQGRAPSQAHRAGGVPPAIRPPQAGGETAAGTPATAPRDYRMQREDRMHEEKERFYSRLASIPGVRPLPSIGDWILLEVSKPAELARKVNRRLAPGVVSVPRHVPGAVRIHIGDPRTNEELLRTIREVVA